MRYAFIILIAALLVAACTAPPTTPPTTQPADSTPDAQEATQELKKAASDEELLALLEQGQTYAPTAYMGGEMLMADMAESAPRAAGASESKGASEYTTTNVQVEGVDEADFVKNDDEHIYLLNQDKLIIIDAYPAEDARRVSTTTIEGRPQNLFLHDDRLLVFVERDDEVMVIDQYDFAPRKRYTQRTYLLIYDVSNPAEPALEREYSITGSLFEARLVGEDAYFVVREPVYYSRHFIDTPTVMEGSRIIAQPDVYYFDNPEENYVFSTVASLDLESEQLEAKSFMMGYGGTLYATQQNLYIAYERGYRYGWYADRNKERFFDVIVPLLPEPTRSTIEGLEDSAWNLIAEELEQMYAAMEEDEQDELIDAIEQAVAQEEMREELERRTTIVHRFSLDDGVVEHEARGEFHGRLLNQFSMDEHDAHLRVATTLEYYDHTQREHVSFNNVFTLDEDLEVVGRLEGLAEGERIYSARFVDDRLYLVTFKRIDPLFVIDLSDPDDPSVLGELKIPGYSDYLHPYDENHIIGIGKETEGNSWGGVSTAGVKVALFDVSDVANPREVDTIEIGEAGSDSPALHDHKAFLLTGDLLVLPVREVQGAREYDPERGYYRRNVWQGAYALTVNPEEGISVRGRVTHLDGEDEEDYSWWRSPYAVRRSIVMDDALYTLSERLVAMHRLADDEDDLTPIGEVSLPYDQERRYEYRYW